MEIRVNVEDRAVLRQLALVRDEMNMEVKKVLVGVAEARVLPHAREIAPKVVRGDLAVTSNTFDAFLTTKKGIPRRRRATVGVLEYGGSIRKPIVPRNAKALRLKDGRFVSKVTAPRRITGKHFLDKAAHDKRPDIEAELERRLTRMIQFHVDMART